MKVPTAATTPTDHLPREPKGPTFDVTPSAGGVRSHHRLTLEAAAAYATHVDAARVRAASEGRTLIYTIKWI